MSARNISVTCVCSATYRRAAEYWPLVMDVARRNNLKRIVRCGQIMGRSEEGDMSAAQIFYPCMQCADIFFLKVGMPHSSCCRLRLVPVAVMHTARLLSC